MFVYSEGPRFGAAEKVSVTTTAQDITAEHSVLIQVKSGTVYVTGLGTADTDCLKLETGDALGFSGSLSVVSDSTAEIIKMPYTGG